MNWERRNAANSTTPAANGVDNEDNRSGKERTLFLVRQRRGRQLVDSSGDISRVVAQLKAGQRDAARPLWDRYSRRLLGLAQAKLGGLPRRALSAFDEEDVALSAFDSFCRGAELGRFPRLEDR